MKELEINNNKNFSPEVLEKDLDITTLIDKLVNEFDKYINEKGTNLKTELKTLRNIKLFLRIKKPIIQEIKSNSILPTYDCLNLSIITCLLAKRKGYNVKIGRPNKISRYFHSLIIRKNGEIFKVAGKNKNYSVTELSIDEIIFRLNNFGPIIKFANLVREKYRNIIKK